MIGEFLDLTRLSFHSTFPLKKSAGSGCYAVHSGMLVQGIEGNKCLLYFLCLIDGNTFFTVPKPLIAGVMSVSPIERGSA